MKPSDDKADDWMPLWIGSYLADTMHLQTVQHGAYFLLLMAYWRDRQPLPDDDDTLRSITKTDRSEWKKMRPVLAKFFKIGEGVWWHKRVEEEIAIADSRKAASRLKAKTAAEARWGKSQNSPPNDAPSNAPSIPQALLEDVHDECPLPIPIPITGIQAVVVKEKTVCVNLPHTLFSDQFRTAAACRPELVIEVVWVNFNNHYTPEKRTLAKWKQWVSTEHSPVNSAPAKADPDSQGAILALAKERGIPKWDGMSQWDSYKKLVIGERVSA